MREIENIYECEYQSSGPYIVAFTAELPEGLDVKPGALVPRRIQRYTHGVLLQQGRETLIHSQELIAFNVQQLKQQKSTCKYFMNYSTSQQKRTLCLRVQALNSTNSLLQGPFKLILLFNKPTCAFIICHSDLVSTRYSEMAFSVEIYTALSFRH